MTGQQLIDAANLNDLGHGYIRFRESQWADKRDYMRLSVFEQKQWNRKDTLPRRIGPWAHLYARRTQEAIGEPTPQAICTLYRPFNEEAFLHEEYELWTGDLDPADKA